MFELGRFGEMIIILVAALIIIGPQELPKVMRTLGRWSQKLQRFKDNLSQNLDHHFYEGKFEEYQKNINQRIVEPDVEPCDEAEDGQCHIFDKDQTNLPAHHDPTKDFINQKSNPSAASSTHNG